MGRFATKLWGRADEGFILQFGYMYFITLSSLSLLKVIFSRYAEPKETHIFYKELAGAAFAIHEWQE